MAQSPPALDTLDIVFLGTIGLGTIAWFARRQIAERLFGSTSSSDAKSNGHATPAPPKRERNFVKIMQEQVTRQEGYMYINIYWLWTCLYTGS